MMSIYLFSLPHVCKQDLEVLRRDVNCELERDNISELKRERRQNHLSHLDTRPGERFTAIILFDLSSTILSLPSLDVCLGRDGTSLHLPVFGVVYVTWIVLLQFMKIKWLKSCEVMHTIVYFFFKNASSNTIYAILSHPLILLSFMSFTFALALWVLRNKFGSQLNYTEFKQKV